jgi:precorrin-6B methylase 2
MCLQDLAVSDDDDRQARRLINLSRAGRTDGISVAGPKALDVLSLLCRHDFERAACARQATCAAADDASDVLILAGLIAHQDLPALLERTLRLLRDGGVLVLQLADLEADLALQTLLSQLGYDPITTVFDLSDAPLVAHTLMRRAAMRMAA